jgi:hypothetical protein
MRYLYAYGPATPQHFAKWLSIPPRYAAGLFGKLGGELEPVELDGESAWAIVGDARTPHEPHRGIHLLPYFDAYVVAGAVMEATPTLTIGPVTVGPHA